jgi:hypothetical protein
VDALRSFGLRLGMIGSLCEAMAGSLSVVTTAVSSAKYAVENSGEVGRSAINSSYYDGPRILPWGTPALTGDSEGETVFNLYRGPVCHTLSNA